MDEQEIPESIGKYEVLRTLGRGGMGAVFEAIDPDIERRVAIKTLHPHLSTGEDGETYLARFRREAQATARCQHPNIVSILEYGRFEEDVYLVMEYVEGRPLDRLMRDEPLPLKAVLKIIIQVLRALDCAHGEGIVHRDIKPSNVMVDGPEAAMVKLTDFGIARMAHASNLTIVGGVVGTPDYMSPEQAFGLETDERSDLFSVGLVFLELLARARYPSRVPTMVMPAVRGLPPSVRVERRRPIPAAFVPVIQGLLEPQLDERIADARTAARGIKAAAARLMEAPNPIHEEETQELDGQTIIRSGPPLVLDTEFDEPTTGTFTTISGIDEARLTEVREALTGLISDQSQEVVREAAESSISFAEFIHAVANEIQSTRKRKKFLSRWGM
ncbi:MAG: serine/threonine-protein kinase [Pseudomonadota bacterium]